MARPGKRTIVRKHHLGASVAQIDTREGSVVALGNLRVLITKSDGSWLAQGLEIDYAIDGRTVTEVKKRFEAGLGLTIQSHLRVHQHIHHLLKAAPPEIWAEYYAANNTLRRFQFSQVSVHPSLQNHLPFGKIEYYAEQSA